MPNGNIVPEYYVLEYPNWVNIIAITKDKKFVMVKQYRPGIEEVCFELCAGVCEDEDLSPLSSAQRELLEETGYGGGVWTEFIRIAPNASAANNWSYCYIAEDVEKIGKQSLEESEDLTVHLVTFNELKDLLENGYSGADGLKEAVDYSLELLRKYAYADQIKISIINGNN
jgi:ADP-ribose pyrophosphatase